MQWTGQFPFFLKFNRPVSTCGNPVGMERGSEGEGMGIGCRRRDARSQEKRISGTGSRDLAPECPGRRRRGVEGDMQAFRDTAKQRNVQALRACVSERNSPPQNRQEQGTGQPAAGLLPQHCTIPSRESPASARDVENAWCAVDQAAHPR